MKIEEFDNRSFSAGMTVIYKNKEYDLVTVDFEEKLIGFFGTPDFEDEDIHWVRCENCLVIQN